MTEDILDVARRMLRHEAENKTIVMQLSMLMDLIDEVDKWRGIAIANHGASNAKPGSGPQSPQSKPKLVDP